MSAREAWNALLAGSFPAAGRALWIGEKRLAPAHATYLRSAAEVTDSREPFDAIGWVARGDLRASARALRARLKPGGALLAMLDEPLVLGALSRALRLAPKVEGEPFAQLGEALLLAGLEQPRLVAAGRPCTALLATKPRLLGPLDAFFEQPAA